METEGERYWRRAAQVAVAEAGCPECEAAPGEPCFYLSRIYGRTEREPHTERLIQPSLGLPPDFNAR